MGTSNTFSTRKIFYNNTITVIILKGFSKKLHLQNYLFLITPSPVVYMTASLYQGCQQEQIGCRKWRLELVLKNQHIERPKQMLFLFVGGYSELLIYQIHPTWPSYTHPFECLLMLLTAILSDLVSKETLQAEKL